MDGSWLDALARTFATPGPRNRRRFLAGVAGLVAAGGALGRADAARIGAGAPCDEEQDCALGLVCELGICLPDDHTRPPTDPPNDPKCPEGIPPEWCELLCKLYPQLCQG